MLWIDIEFVPKIFNIVLDGSSSFSAPVFLKMVKHVDIPNSEIQKIPLQIGNFLQSAQTTDEKIG